MYVRNDAHYAEFAVEGDTGVVCQRSQSRFQRHTFFPIGAEVYQVSNCGSLTSPACKLVIGQPTPRYAPERLSEPILVLTLSLVGYSERSSTGAWVSVTRRLNRPLNPIAVLRPGSGRQGRYTPLYARHLLLPPLFCSKPSSNASSLSTNSRCSRAFISTETARR